MRKVSLKIEKEKSKVRWALRLAVSSVCLNKESRTSVEHRRCRGRNTEERLEHKHLPQSRLLLPITSWYRNSTTNTHFHKQKYAQFWQMHSDVLSINIDTLVRLWSRRLAASFSNWRYFLWTWLLTALLWNTCWKSASHFTLSTNATAKIPKAFSFICTW